MSEVLLEEAIDSGKDPDLCTHIARRRCNRWARGVDDDSGGEVPRGPQGWTRWCRGGVEGVGSWGVGNKTAGREALGRSPGSTGRVGLETRRDTGGGREMPVSAAAIPRASLSLRPPASPSMPTLMWRVLAGRSV